MSLLKLLSASIIVFGLVFSANSLAADSTKATTENNITAQKTVPTKAVDINSADAKTLMTLKGMTNKKANAIVDYRTKNGAFASVDDLTKVKGLGKKSVDKLKQQNPDLIVAKSKAK
jgi:comEA protein